MTVGKSKDVFLKAIQIQGFKSFADKIRLDLEPGLSVIVGPNGSGKSNVADAVRWVLGEQSAKSLRGSKMEDVIFAGSAARRSVGMAEVSLIFDNASGLFALDYEEVVITRRVYRDGEGHYFINKTPCRLKDIQELFMDTGSGKEGFSIIGQGRVEEILNLKAEERRLLIEEVAGISKYRLRKKETLKKLEDTEQNVERLNDIISEIEARIEPLAQQAQVAKLSKDLHIQLEKTEIRLIANELYEIYHKLSKSQAELQRLNQELTLFTTQITEEENLGLRAKYELNLMEERLAVLQSNVYSLENKAKEAEHTLSLLAERLKYGQEQLSRIEAEINNRKDKIAQSDMKIISLTGKEAVLLNNLKEASRSLQDKEKLLAELRSLSGDSRLEELKSEIFEEMSNKSKLSNTLTEIKHKTTTLERQRGQLSENISLNKSERQTLQAEILEQEAKKKELETTLTELQQELEYSKASITTKKDEQTLCEHKRLQMVRSIDQSQARLHALQALEDNLEGYQKGVKQTILAFRKGDITCDSLYGTVAENIEVNPNHELAIETALGPMLQNIIVETTEDGKRCIAYLKKTNNGRATFLPRDAISGTKAFLEQKTKNHKGFLGLAVELVHYEDKFNNIMQSLMGRILVADTMDSAIEIARLNNYKLRVVTLQGDQVNVGGSLTGGSTRTQNSGLLSRSRDIEELKVKINELQLIFEKKKQEELTHANELAKLQQQKENLEGQIQSLNETKGILLVEHKHKENRRLQLEESARLIEFEIKDVLNALEELQEEEVTNKYLLEQAGQKLIELQGKQSDLENQLKATNIQVSALAEEITTAKVEVARWEQERDQTQQAIGEEKERLHRLHQDLEEKNQEKVNIQNSQLESQEAQVEAEQEIQKTGQELDEQKYLLLELRQEKEEFSKENLKQEEKILQKRKQIKEIEQHIHQHDLRLARLQTEWDTGLSRLQDVYALTWEQAQEYLTEEKKEGLQETVATLKKQIEELGSVNYTALEEYPETLKRFEFMSMQRDDLIEAANSLLQLIGELDKKMIERFAEGFKAVNDAFKEVFKQLFNGGYAELQLDDPENLLETGVKIIAQPPGKKAQLLSLLSGGERAFTAIALLFAFLKVKPSPFCLLDEIEAALDESNVKRFVQYLHTLSDHTQFIVISHRRGTMELADRLYGITMEESGISKLLTVALEDREKPEIA